jgi:hypothetical protein
VQLYQPVCPVEEGIISRRKKVRSEGGISPPKSVVTAWDFDPGK